jgi:hypothetical protein
MVAAVLAVLNARPQSPPGTGALGLHLANLDTLLGAESSMVEGKERGEEVGQ